MGEVVRDRPIKVALLEHCGTGNLGDEATVAAVLRGIRSRLPHVSIVGLSLNPSDTERRHSIPSYPIRQSVFPCQQTWSSEPQEPNANTSGFKAKLKARLSEHRLVLGIIRALFALLVMKPWKFSKEVIFLITSLHMVADLDCLVVCGGGQLLDRGGPWAFPYTLFKWVLLAKISGAKCLFLNLGAGPLIHPLSKWFIKRALLLADYVSFRDGQSRALIRDIGFRNASDVVADCVYDLHLTKPNILSIPSRRRNELTIGIAPTAYRDPSRYWECNDADYQAFIRKFAGLGARLILQGHRLRLFSSDIWFDSKAIADLQRTIKAELPVDAADRITCEPVTGIDDFVKEMSQVDYFVTCKYHGVVFAHRLDVPVLAVAHHPKVATLMKECGLSEFSVDIADFDGDRLAAAFERLIANVDEVRTRTRQRVVGYQAALAGQFDRLFSHGGLAGRARRSREVHK